MTPAIPLGPMVLILGSPRSGTSLTASIFAAHGVWVGPSRPADSKNPRGYYENKALAALRSAHRTAYAMAPPLLEKQGYAGGPWMVKHTPHKWDFWEPFDPVVVLCWRNFQACARSSVNHGAYGKATLADRERVAVRDHKIMSKLAASRPSVSVYPDEFIQGDFISLRPAFRALGLTLDPRTASDQVDPTLWHH